MARSKAVYGVTTLLVILIVGMVWSTDSAAATSAKSTPPPPPSPYQLSHSSQTYIPGFPAIQPRFSPNASGPAFTQDDVRAYLNRHGFFAGPIVQGAHLHILTIQFVNAKQASQLMYGESVGRPDGYLVCYVKVEGPFLLTNVHGGPPQPNVTQPTTAQYGDAVFDAHTGNLLVWGVYFQ